MKHRIITGVVATALFVFPVFAAESHKEAVKQCKTEYSEAKREAGKKSTRAERSAAKKEAKHHYEECVEKAKHKS